MSRSARRLLIASLAVMLTLGAGVLWLLWERCGLAGCPQVDRLDAFVSDAGSRVLDRNGVELARLHMVRREVVPLDSLPDYVPEAFIAIEDQRFWEHNGIDWTRIGGALVTNLRARRIRQGFSTITMQLARNAFPERLSYLDRTVGRKFAEVRVARAIESRYTKEQILELYLNHIYFGGAAWGIEAAAQEYFRKPATELTLAEAALLAGMISAPNGLNPRTNPVYAYQRRWVVLHVMWRVGVITADEANEASNSPLVTDESTAEAGKLAPYFVETVRAYLERELGEAIYTNGYTIHTTLDAELQAVAEEELRARLEAVEAGRFGAYLGQGEAEDGEGDREDGEDEPNPLQGAVLVIEAESGDVLAMVGGRDFEQSRFNRALLARRQMASTIKPFIYAAALEQGYTPAHRLNDLPIRRDMGGGKVWAPRNYENRYAPAISFRDALVLSSNSATIRLAEDIGLDRVAALAHRAGLSGPFPLVPALALGAAEATLFELVTAYGSFATLGRGTEPRIVTRVEDRAGRTVWQQPISAREVLDPGVAFLVTDILRDVVERGTGRGVRAAGFDGPAAGKTGTAHSATDLWFVGYTPTRVAGIWIGHDLPRPISEDASAEQIAAPLWGRIMRRGPAERGQPWTPPTRVESRRVDGEGRVYGTNCRVTAPVRLEYFLIDSAPGAECGAPAPRAPGVPAPAPPGPDTTRSGADSLVVPAGQTPEPDRDP